MKFLLIAFAVVAANCFVLSRCQITSPSPPDSGLADATKKCMVQENVDHQYVIDFASGHIKTESVSGAFKCFVRCVIEGRGYMKDGQLLEENIVKAAENITSVDQVRKIISSCKIHKGSNACETAFNIYMCISSELK